ncbi:MAG: hypothetical protein Q7K43_03860, partial [Candidatus Woesearchaeota archaeon]|nr:hypothetical protein [Candidatus Woesearchaeota archaeon]
MHKPAYEVLRKKHKLPSFDVINADFHISAIESEVNVLSEIRTKAEDKIDYLLHLLNAVLQPEPTSLADLYEYNALNTAQRTCALSVFKQLMIVKCVLSEAEIIGAEQVTALAICTAHKALTEKKKDLLELLKLFKEYWQ